MRPARVRIGAVALAAAVSLAAAEKPGPGSYCPLPEPGEVPRCLGDAEAEFGELLAGADEGRVADGDAARVEAAIEAGPRGERPYLALSTLAHAYYRLSKRAEAQGDADPAVAARLERWNALLTRAYAEGEADEAWQASIRTAALDLDENAPAVALECRDEDGNPVACESTGELVRALDALNERSGIRGALGRLLERFIGDGS